MMGLFVERDRWRVRRRDDVGEHVKMLGIIFVDDGQRTVAV
jgi:hypothetical protein